MGKCNLRVLKAIKQIPEVDAASHAGSTCLALTSLTSFFMHGIPLGLLFASVDACFLTRASVYDRMHWVYSEPKNQPSKQQR